jgi:putative phosphoribosyl transferase
MNRQPNYANGFSDRREAGRALAGLVCDLSLPDPLVLAVPRGGVPVADEVAAALGAPLDVFVARKIGAPHQREFAIGAVAEGGTVFFDELAVRSLGLSPGRRGQLAEAAQQELARRVERYRGARALPDVRGKSVVLVDDGVATGRTIRAALTSLHAHEPGRLVLATPVCAPETAAELHEFADDVISVLLPGRLIAVGAWYADFRQTCDSEVTDILAAARRPR